MTNDNEIKARLFALYWGQDVRAFKDYLGREQVVTLNNLHATYGISRDYLLLRPLSSITDEEVKGAMLLMGWGCSEGHARTIIAEFILEGNEAYKIIALIDWLRGRGYALPFNGMPVKEQVEKGFIKLREEGK